MKNIFELLESANIIATVGTCKNAGKTTVLNFLVSQYQHQFHLGITSIGYDGEETDAVTKLPKPRIEVYPGMYVATGNSCLLATNIKFEYIYDTGIKTAVGTIHIIKVLTKGILEVSGPSMASQISMVSHKMIELGCSKVIADGAAGRISFANVADAVVLSVGAAMSTDMNVVVEKAGYLTELLQLKPEHKIMSLQRPEEDIYTIQQIHGKSYYVFRGALADKDVNDFLEKKASGQISGKIRIVVKNATRIFVNHMTYKRFLHKGGVILVQEAVQLKVVTINPMTPYGEWFDKEEFLKQMGKRISIPVFNIMNEKVNNNEK